MIAYTVLSQFGKEKMVNIVWPQRVVLGNHQCHLYYVHLVRKLDRAGARNSIRGGCQVVCTLWVHSTCVKSI